MRTITLDSLTHRQVEKLADVADPTRSVELALRTVKSLDLSRTLACGTRSAHADRIRLEAMYSRSSRERTR